MISSIKRYTKLNSETFSRKKKQIVLVLVAKIVLLNFLRSVHLCSISSIYSYGLILLTYFSNFYLFSISFLMLMIISIYIYFSKDDLYFLGKLFLCNSLRKPKKKFYSLVKLF